jgi:DNA mismatch endonuclease Vsr
VADRVSKETRSKIMRSIQSKDTEPEVIVRKILTGLGYRYRLHKKDLPGRPDIVFIGRKKAIFINGCFWHMHEGCVYAQMPESAFWKKKLTDNKARDKRAATALEERGWLSTTIWECELKNRQNVIETLINFLGPPTR